MNTGGVKGLTRREALAASAAVVAAEMLGATRADALSLGMHRPLMEEAMAQNMGNMGNMGNLGNLGTVARFGYSVSMPDRVDLPFIAERMPGDRASNSPREEVRKMRIPLDSWPARCWAGEWRAWLVLAEFARTDWHQIRLEDWQDPKRQEKELEQLSIMAEDERADALGEIVAQDGLYSNFLAEFTTLLGVTPETHPTTVALLHTGGVVGILVSMHLKNSPTGSKDVPPRPRPSQLLPALKPPIAVPGHPAYPSGHAMQAALMAKCAGAALEKLPEEQRSTMGKLLDVLAGRIARNREIAGLHYASDSDAGRKAANQAFDKLKGLVSFTDLIKQASNEWTSSP